MDNGSQILRTITPEMYRTNIFRVAQLPADASARKARDKLRMREMQAKLGIRPEPQRGQLKLHPAPNDVEVNEAIERMHDPLKRIVDEFFWFWPLRLGESDTDQALQHLARGAPGHAQKVWLSNPDADGVAVHNDAVVQHLIALDLEFERKSKQQDQTQVKNCALAWKGAYKRWREVLQHPRFWQRFAERIKEFNDPRLDVGVAPRFRQILPQALLSIHVGLAKEAFDRGQFMVFERQIELIRQSRLEAAAIRSAMWTALDPYFLMIERECEALAATVKATPRHGAQLVSEFRRKEEPRLVKLRERFESGDHRLEKLFDSVAEACLEGLITFANETSNWQVTVTELRALERIACGTMVRRRLTGSLKTVEENLAEALCFFCGRYNQQHDLACEIKMFGNVQRIPIPGGSRVTWNTSSVRVPRCPTCRQAHSHEEAAAGLGCLSGLIAGGAAWWFMHTWSGAGVFVGVAFVCFLVGVFIGACNRPKGVQPAAKAAEHPRVKQLRAEGWQLGEKPANVNN